MTKSRIIIIVFGSGSGFGFQMNWDPVSDTAPHLILAIVIVSKSVLLVFDYKEEVAFHIYVLIQGRHWQNTNPFFLVYPGRALAGRFHPCIYS